MKYSKGAVLVLAVTMICLALTGCGQKVTEEDYRNSIVAAAEEFDAALEEFGKVLNQTEAGNAESIDAVISKLTELEESGEKLRDLKTNENYAEVQDKYKQAAQKYLDAFAEYKKAFAGYVSGNISQADFESTISSGSSMLTEGAGLMSEANTMMRNKNTR